MRLNVVDWVAYALTIVGGLNWGLVGLFNFDLVKALFGGIAFLPNIIYALVGVSAVYLIVMLAARTSATPASVRS